MLFTNHLPSLANQPIMLSKSCSTCQQSMLHTCPHKPVQKCHGSRTPHKSTWLGRWPPWRLFETSFSPRRSTTARPQFPSGAAGTQWLTYHRPTGISSQVPLTRSLQLPVHHRPPSPLSKRTQSCECHRHNCGSRHPSNSHSSPRQSSLSQATTYATLVVCLPSLFFLTQAYHDINRLT